MQALSKTAAIRESANTASITGRGTSWQVYGPYDVTDPSGPSTCINADSYVKARIIATQWRAEVSLALMGRYDDAARYAVDYQAHDSYSDHSLSALIDAGSAAFGTGPSAADIAEASMDYWRNV